ncbi:MAG: hypothetical protein IPM66_05640 [Acidobacteriota bacterium]|nr:MAG: hypothetical protein IPM66_05640 [Acidobacteriota bacterium]
MSEGIVGSTRTSHREPGDTRRQHKAPGERGDFWEHWRLSSRTGGKAIHSSRTGRPRVTTNTSPQRRLAAVAGRVLDRAAGDAAFGGERAHLRH